MSQEKESPNTEQTENTSDVEHEIVDESVDSEQATESNDSTDSSNSETEPTEPDSKQDSETDLQTLLDAANKKADDNWDQMLRTKAEMENLRRRSRLDVENAHKFAVEKFVTQLIPVIDSLELGLTNVGKDDHEQLEKLHEGSEMTLKMFQDVFNKFDIETLDPVNETFNPEFHQAMVMQESADVKPNTVIMVMQKGYTLNDRLVRPAMVSVSKAVVTDSTDATDAAGTTESGEQPEATKKIDEKA